MTHPGARRTICVRSSERPPTPDLVKLRRLSRVYSRSCQPRRISYYTLLFTLLLTVTNTRLGDLPGTFPILSTLPVWPGRTLVSQVYDTSSRLPGNLLAWSHHLVNPLLSRRPHSAIFMTTQKYPRITWIRQHPSVSPSLVFRLPRFKSRLGTLLLRSRILRHAFKLQRHHVGG